MSELVCTRCGQATAVLVAPGEYEWVVTAATPDCEHEVIDEEFGLSMVPCEHPSSTGIDTSPFGPPVSRCDSCGAIHGTAEVEIVIDEQPVERALQLVTVGGGTVKLIDREGVEQMWDTLSSSLTRWVEAVTPAFEAFGRAIGSLSMTLNPELWRLLFKPRRGWKGHGAPPLYALHPWEPLPSPGKPRKRPTYRGRR